MLLHEVCHLLRPEVMHDEPWRETLIEIWREEFQIVPEFARLMLAEAGLES